MRTGTGTAAAGGLIGVLLAACGAGGGSGDAAQEPASSPGQAIAGLRVTSPAFADGQAIPAAFTCFEAGITPPDLAWSGVPAGTASVAVVVDDPDAPGATFIHWVVTGLPGADGGITGGKLPPGAQQGDNSGGAAGWAAPCPPTGAHHYRFRVYALSGPLPGATRDEQLGALDRLAVAKGTLTGTVAAPTS